MKRTGAALAAAMWILAAAAASASEQSKIQTTRGLVELNAGREQEALRRFAAAVEADGRDPLALYYRGVTRGRRGGGGAVRRSGRLSVDRTGGEERDGRGEPGGFEARIHRERHLMLKSMVTGWPRRLTETVSFSAVRSRA